MISPISSVSGYSVQAIYGNPASMKPITSVSDSSVANKAMMTVSKKDNIDLDESSNKSIEIGKPEEKNLRTTALATGGIADIVKQIAKMNNSDEDSSENATSTVNSNLFEEDFLRMGFQQNIRDKVGMSTPQSELADVTQKAAEMQMTINQQSGNTPDVLTQKAEQFVSQAIGAAS